MWAKWVYDQKNRRRKNILAAGKEKSKKKKRIEGICLKFVVTFINRLYCIIQQQSE